MAFSNGFTLFRPSSIPSGLVGYWPLNGNANASTGANFSVTGSPTYTALDYWKTGESSILLDQSGEYLSIANASATTYKFANSAFSANFWVKVTTWNSFYNFVINMTSNSSTKGWSVNFANDGSIAFSMNGSTTNTAGSVMGLNRWHMVTVVYDKTNRMIYRDGNLMTFGAYTTDLDGTCSGDLVISPTGTSPADLWINGLLKDLAMWNRALTPQEIKSLAMGVDLSKYSYRPNHVSVQPTRWWKLDEASGSRAATIGSATLTDSGSVLSSGGYCEGASALFSGSNKLVAANHADYNFDSSASFTLTAWVRPTGSGTYNTIGNGYTTGWLLQLGGSSIDFWIANHRSSIRSFTFVSGTWYFVSVRKNGTSVSIEVDGMSLGTDTMNYAASSANDLWFGNDPADDTDYNGNIQDVAIWKGYALSDDEIKSLACGLSIQRQGVVDYFKMDAVSGNEAGVLHGTSAADNGSVGSAVGKVGTARDFTPNDYFRITRTVDFDLLNDFSILGYIYPDDNTDVNIIGKNQQTGGYGVLLNSTGYMEFRMNGQISVSTTTFPTTGFAHFACVYSGSTRAVWRNAIVEASDAYSTNNTDNTTDVFIGSSSTPASYFDGRIDELVIAKRYFRPEEIKAVYLKGLSGKEAMTSERPVGGGFMPFFI